MKLEVTELTKKYADKTVFDAWSYKFDSNIYAVVGKNGSGKSTLLEILAGAEVIDKGQILLEEKNLLTHASWYKQQLGYCPDRLNFYSFLKVIDFFRLITKIKNTPSVDRHHSLVKGFGIVEYLDTSLDKLSLGTQKKVLLVAALLGKPNLLLLDEPTDELDTKSKDFLIEELESRRPTTTIIATHDEYLIKQLGAEVVSLAEPNN